MTNEEDSTVTKVLKQQSFLMRRFSIVRKLGEGASSAVYHALDRDRDNRPVALKLLVNAEAFDEHTLTRFHEEFEALKKIHHPNVVAAYDFFGLGRDIAFAMEFIDGRDLGQLLSRGPVPALEIDRIMSQVLEGLGALHEAQVLHRDLKLENVLVSKDGVAKISDLGLMRRLDQEGITRTGILLGTAQYLPPEYIKSGEYDARGDLYAIGVMIFELASGTRRLADKRGMEVLEHLIRTKFPLPDFSQYPRISERHVEIVTRAMNSKPRKRYQSAAEMRAALTTAEVPLPMAPQIEVRGTIGMQRVPVASRRSVGSYYKYLLFLLLIIGGVVAGAWSVTGLKLFQHEQIVLEPGTYEGRVNMFGNTGYFKEITLLLRDGTMSVESELFKCKSEFSATSAPSCTSGEYTMLIDRRTAKGYDGYIEDRTRGGTHRFEMQRVNPPR